jgi:hypothetical protein
MNNKVQPFFEDVTLWNFNMKKSKGKSKCGRGGARPGAGGGCRWKHGRTKSVRLPVALLDKILEVARYMDQNDGNLPPSAPVVITSGHLSESLSGEELKEFLAKKKARKLASKVMCGDERVLVSDKTFAAFDIFDLPPAQKARSSSQ